MYVTCTDVGVNACIFVLVENVCITCSTASGSLWKQISSSEDNEEWILIGIWHY